MAYASQARRQPTSVGTLSIWSFAVQIFAFAADFRGEEGSSGSIQQAIFLGLYLGSFGLFLLSTGFRPNSRAMTWFLGLVTWFVLEGFGLGFVNKQEAYQLVINALSIFIYASAAYSTYHVIAFTKEYTRILNIILWACLVYAVSKIIRITLSGDLDLNTIRYQIIGASAPAALALLPIFFVKKTPARLQIFTYGLNVAIILLSVTRTFLLIGAAAAIQLLPTLVMLTKTPRFYLALRFLLAFLVIGLIVDQATGGLVSQRWIDRLFVADDLGDDPTKLSRNAEVYFMQEEWLASPAQVAFGNGLAAKTGFSGPDAYWASFLVGNKQGDGDVHMAGFGHHNHWSLIFIGGLLAGLPLLIAQFYHAFLGLFFLRMVQRYRGISEALVELGFWGGGIVLATIINGFLSPVMADRGFCLWWGIGTGMVLGATAVIKSSSLPTRVSDPGRKSRRPSVFLDDTEPTSVVPLLPIKWEADGQPNASSPSNPTPPPAKSNDMLPPITW